jgi:hypothetical protein
VHLARAGFQVTGLDISPTGLHLTREWLAAHAGRLALFFFACDITAIP